MPARQSFSDGGSNLLKAMLEYQSFMVMPGALSHCHC
jgi:hypothetical protein